MDILLLGPPGAGKGTQGTLIADRLGLPKFATGDLLRDAVKRGTPVGLKARAVMESGGLVSDEIIMGVVREELVKPEAKNGVIFDGVVRTVPQAEGVTRILTELGRRMDVVLFFDVADAEILARIGPAAHDRGAGRRRPEGGRHPADRLPRADRAGARLVSCPGRCACGRGRGERPGYRSEREDDPRPIAATGRSARTGPSPKAAMITLKSPREIETMARAGRIVGRDAGLDAPVGPSGHDHPRPRQPRRSVHPQSPRCQAIVQRALRLPQDALHLDQRRDRPRHPQRQTGAAGGEHREHRRRSAAGRAARRLGDHGAGRRDFTRGGTPAPGDPATVWSRGSPRPASAIMWATSVMRCSSWPRRRGSGWCGSWWDTASGHSSTRSRRCPTMASPSAGRGCSRG